MSNSTSSEKVFFTKKQFKETLSKFIDDYADRVWDELTMGYKTLKVVLIGDERTGKTEYIKRFGYKRFNEAYIPTLGAELYEIKFHTDCGDYKFRVWDVGNDNYRGLKSLGTGYYLNADACIAFYTKNSDHKKTDEAVKEFLKLNPKAKVVNVWGKCDLPEENNHFREAAKIDGIVNDFIFGNDFILGIPISKFVNVRSKSSSDGYSTETGRSYLLRDREDSFACQISGKTSYNRADPFLRILSSLLNKQNVFLTQKTWPY